MTGTDRDLFGKRIRKKRTRLEILLGKRDRITLSDRVDRFKFLRTLISPRTGIFGPTESVFMFEEAQLAFINGEFIAVILLAQAFVERQLESQMDAKGYPGGSRGLKYILKHCKQHGLLPKVALNKIEHIRNIRNSFAHLKPFEYPYNLSQRLFRQHGREFRTPGNVLLDDAKEALRTMITMVSLKIR